MSKIHIITKLRNKVKLTVKELSNIIGVSTTTIYLIENGKYNVSENMIKKLSDALKCTPETINNGIHEYKMKQREFENKHESRYLLKKFRTEKNITAKQLSDLTNVSKNYISKIESGRIKLSKNMADKICKILECKIDDILPNDKTPVIDITDNNIKPIKDETQHDIQSKKRVCGLCIHPNRYNIEMSYLNDKITQASIAKKYNIHLTQVNRHFATHCEITKNYAKNNQLIETLSEGFTLDKNNIMINAEKYIQDMKEITNRAIDDLANAHKLIYDMQQQLIKVLNDHNVEIRSLYQSNLEVQNKLLSLINK